jgi:hypothetical protein
MVAISSSRESSDGLLGHPSSPLVLRIRGTEYDGREVRLQAAKCTIGSGPTCTFRLRAAGVRPLHCLILRGRQGAVIRRWSSGTYLNGGCFTDSLLREGDRISIGPVELEVVSVSEPTTASEPGEVDCRRDDSTDLVAALEARIAQLEAEIGADGASPGQVAESESPNAGEDLASQQQELHRELDRTREDLARERQEGEAHRRRLEEQLVQAKQQAECVRKQLAEAEDRQRTFSERDVVRQTELAQVRAELEAARKAADTPGDLNDKLQAAEAETAKCREQADWWRRRAEQIEIESQQIAHSQQQAGDTELRERLDHEREELQQQQEQWRQEKEQLQHQAEAQAEELRRQLAQQREQTDEALSQLESERAVLQQVQSELTDAQADRTRREQTHREQYDTWQSRQSELEQQLSDKEEQLQGLRQRLEDAEQSQASLQRECIQAQEELQKKDQKVNDESPEVQQEREVWERERNRLEAELEARTKQFAEQHAQLRNEREELHSEWESLRAERRQFESQRDSEAERGAEAEEEAEHVVPPLWTEVEPGEVGEGFTGDGEQGAPPQSFKLQADPSVPEVEFEAPFSNLLVGAEDVLFPMGQPLNWDEEGRDSLAALEEGEVEPQPQRNTGTPEGAEGDDEESIEEYMARLLKRVRGDDDSSSSPLATTASDSPPVGKPATESLQQPSFVVEFMAEASEFRPRSQAPELSTNLQAMRELANESARTAIDSSTRRRGSSAAGGKFLLAAVALVIGVVLLFVPSMYAFCGAVVLFIIGLLFGVQGVVYARRYLAAVHKQGELDTAKNAMRNAPTAESEGDGSHFSDEGVWGDPPEQAVQAQEASAGGMLRPE